MKKEDLASLVTEYGDAVITYRSENSKKLKYNVCTLDFITLLLGYRFLSLIKT
jgi:hypothetical protein